LLIADVSRGVAFARPARIGVRMPTHRSDSRRRRTLGGAVAAAALLIAPRGFSQRLPVEAPHGMVVGVQEIASEVGADILRKGGNAIDAAVATGFALTVVYPWAGNLGGGGFMLVHLADGRDLAIDYRETAPAAAGREMFLGPDGHVIKGPGSSTVGWRASGVPGTVAGFALALEKYGSGKISWADAIEPARRLAADGHLVTPYNASRLKSQSLLLSQFPETKRIFLKDGALLQPGERWRQPELAATLARLQKNGPREFYEGETARLITAAMMTNSGTITAADLKNYLAVERVPVRGTYRGFEIVAMPPPSSSGIALLQMLAMLEPFDVAALGHNSSAKYHLFVEVMRRAYRERAEYLGDPDFVRVPMAGLLDRRYVASLMKNFEPSKATPSAGLSPGKPMEVVPGGGGEDRPAKPTPHEFFSRAIGAESSETTHYSIVDVAGNAVANTYTLNGGFGSGVTIPGAGFLMNNEMDDFTAKPGVPNAYGLIQGENNAIVPGKRPLSSMTPTFVFRDGKLVLVTGTPGGSTIINTVLQVITNIIDHRMPVTQAVEAPRISHQWMPDVIDYEPFGMSADVMNTLRAMGHTLATRDVYGDGTSLYDFYLGDAETIAIDPKTNLRQGAADPRKPDAKAVGY